MQKSRSQLSKHFSLNELRHTAFVIAGSHLLDSLLRATAEGPPGKPLRKHIYGEGGTGKSRVLEALRYLIKRGEASAVVKVAPTGIYAVLIEVETVHSKLQTLNFYTEN